MSILNATTFRKLIQKLVSVLVDTWLALRYVSQNYFESAVDNNMVAQIWLTIASVLATFNIDKSKDDTGSEEEVEAAYSDAASRCLQYFFKKNS